MCSTLKPSWPGDLPRFILRVYAKWKRGKSPSANDSASGCRDQVIKTKLHFTPEQIWNYTVHVSVNVHINFILITPTPL